MIRSALAILAGIAVLTITSFAIEALLPARAGTGHSLPATLFQFAYTALCIAAGGTVTAWLARRSQIRHAVMMGALEVALTVWAMLSFPHKAPLVNWMAGMALTVPAAWLGGRLWVWQTARNVKQPAARPS